MRAYIISLTVLLVISFAAFPVFAEEGEDTKPEKVEKKVIIETTDDGSYTAISGCDSEECKIIFEDGVLEIIEEGDEGEVIKKKVIIDCPEYEGLDLSGLDLEMEELEAELSELDCGIEIEEFTGEDGKIYKKIIVDPDAEIPDMSKFEMDLDVDLDKAGLTTETMTITMKVEAEEDKVTIEARGDKEKLKPEIDEMVEELTEDGGKVTTEELENGYDITITK